MHRDTTIYILKTKVAPDFLGAYHGPFFLSLSLSLSFSMWILYAGVSKIQQVFYYFCLQLAGKTQNITDTLRLLRSQNKELQFYSGKVHILTDLSANSTCPSL